MIKILHIFLTLYPTILFSQLRDSVKIKTPKVKKHWEELLIFTKKQNPGLSKSVDEFSKMVNELYKITPNPDIRKFNFGYTDKGILKCLDI